RTIISKGRNLKLAFCRLGILQVQANLVILNVFYGDLKGTKAGHYLRAEHVFKIMRSCL
ncbi:Hypothetical predicted protein, partial [Paramuricea clavata]